MFNSTIRNSTLICAILMGVVTASCQTNKSKTAGTTNGTKTATTPKTGGSIEATITAVYTKKEKPGIYDVDIRMKNGRLKPGDKVDVVSASGTRYSLTVKSMRNPYENISFADNTMGTVYILLEGADGLKFDADFALVNAGGSAGGAPKESTAKFSGTVNGQPWKGKDFYHSCSLFKKGVKKFNQNKPYLILAFKSMDAVDDRQFTIMVFTADAKPGVYKNEQIEILLSGSPVGDQKNPEMWGHKHPGTVTDNLTVTITDFQLNADGSATITGTIKGAMKRVLGKGEMPVDAKFTSVRVDVYKDEYM